MTPPTEKQMAFIEDISEEIGVDFRGKTKEEATRWIRKYKPFFDKAVYMRELEIEGMLLGVDGRRDW